MSTEKTALQKAIEQIEKDYGKGSIIIPSSATEKIDVISTGSLTLDIATGVGGLPRGKIVEIMGWESSGKSTIVLQTIANAQKMGLKCVLFDGEFSFDTTYAMNLGVDVDNLLIKQLDEGGAERCYDIAEILMKTGEIGMLVFDSQTSLLTKKALESDNGTSIIGLQARMMSISVPKILNAAALGNTLVVYVSQFREKIGEMFGNPETTSGGNALKFYAHMRIEMRKTLLKDEKSKEIMANKTTTKVVKNKVAPPFKKATFRIDFGEGVNRIYEILDLGVDLDIIKMAGSWYSYKDTRLGQGEANIYRLLRDNEELANSIESEILETIQNAKKNTVA